MYKAYSNENENSLPHTPMRKHLYFNVYFNHFSKTKFICGRKRSNHEKYFSKELLSTLAEVKETLTENRELFNNILYIRRILNLCIYTKKFLLKLKVNIVNIKSNPNPLKGLSSTPQIQTQIPHATLTLCVDPRQRFTVRVSALVAKPGWR